jgi:hypothetical protein
MSLLSPRARRWAARRGEPADDCTLPCHWPPTAERRRVAAEQEHPRLWVGFDYPGSWSWMISEPNGCLLDSGVAETWDEAMAVGLAALEVASLA